MSLGLHDILSGRGMCGGIYQLESPSVSYLNGAGIRASSWDPPLEKNNVIAAQRDFVLYLIHLHNILMLSVLHHDPIHQKC